MVHGEKLMIAITAPNVPMADRRFNIAVDLATSERFMIVSWFVPWRINANHLAMVLRI